VTHAELVKRAERWLRSSKRCGLVLCEIGTARESPDAIGWTYGAQPHLVECKASVDDYRKDAKKWFRRMPEHGLGAFRWYFAPPQVAEAIASHIHSVLLGLAEVPSFGTNMEKIGGRIALQCWGVVACLPRGQRVLRQASRFTVHNEREEARILVSACRRATEGWGRKVFGEVAPPLVDGDPHPTTARIIKDLRAENRRLRYRESEDVIRLTQALNKAEAAYNDLLSKRRVTDSDF